MHPVNTNKVTGIQTRITIREMKLDKIRRVLRGLNIADKELGLCTTPLERKIKQAIAWSMEEIKETLVILTYQVILNTQT